jgi:hypothetical protein
MRSLGRILPRVVQSTTIVLAFCGSALSQDLGTLPVVSSPDERGALIQGAGVIPFKRKLPREVGSFVERDLLTIEAGRLSGFESASQAPPLSVGDLVGWLENAPTRSAPSRKLWDLALVNAQGLTRRLRVEQAILPVSAGHLSATQSFREFLTLKMPQPLAGYSWLTFRMRGEEEDAVWVGAPSFTNQVRQISGANRGEAIVPGGVAPDEFGVFAVKGAWIGNPDMSVTSQLVAINRRAVPFQPSAGGGCELSGGEPFGRWNFDGQRMKDSKPWSPTDAIFTERNVARLQFAHGDPQTANLFEEVVVDLDTKLPVYRTSYGPGSTPLRVIIGVLGFRDNAERTPFIVSQIVFSPSTADVALLGLRQLELCQQGAGGFTLEAFDPSSLGVAVSATPAADKGKPSESPPTPIAKERVIGSGRTHTVAIFGHDEEQPAD